MPQSDPYPHYIEFRHVYKTFDKPVLVDVSFTVDPGETVAIIGRSGVERICSIVPISHSRAIVSDVNRAAMICRITAISPGTT